MIQKVLLAVSGLGHAEEMLRNLKDLPSLKQAKVTVLHVVPPQATAGNMTAKWEEGGKILANAIQNLNLDPSQVSSILRQGEPKDLVCKVADEIDADLIIMGSRGLKRLQSILANSVSQYVFQLSSRPMLLVKDDIYVKKVNRIMVGLDGSEASKNCLQLALFLVRDIPGGQLFLSHVISDLRGASADASEIKPEQNPILIAAAAEARKQGVEPRCIIAAGQPGEKLCRMADEFNVDLLLMGSPDRRPSIAKSFVDLDKLIGVSLSDYVRVNAPCPVLLARTVAA